MVSNKPFGLPDPKGSRASSLHPYLHLEASQRKRLQILYVRFVLALNRSSNVLDMGPVRPMPGNCRWRYRIRILGTDFKPHTGRLRAATRRSLCLQGSLVLRSCYKRYETPCRCIS